MKGGHMALVELLRYWFALIQGGMGIGISGWRLARAVSMAGGLGIVSGTAIHFVFVRILQLGDPGGHYKRAVDAFPYQEAAQRVYRRYFIKGGKRKEDRFKDIEMLSISPSHDLIELIILANFAEVWLAKEGHPGFVGINFLEKVQIPHIYSLYGAMLAGVNFVTIGAGIPSQFPGIMERLTRGQEVEYRLDVIGAESGEFTTKFDPKIIFEQIETHELKIPLFFPIISSTILAKRMAKELPEKIAAFIIEGPTAGGHNAPPRVKGVFNSKNEPVYGVKDEVNLVEIGKIGIPYILAGSFPHHEKINQAVFQGAVGVQLGSIFQFCRESGLRLDLKHLAIELALQEELNIFTSMVSPTGYPFKIALLPGTLSEKDVYESRLRICDLGLLREIYKIGDGLVGYRCSAEPVKAYIAKGGNGTNTIGKACLCNCLLSNLGLGQVRTGDYIEPPLVTCGDDISFLLQLLKNADESYFALDAINHVIQ
jgi:nitronate monooxygenase